MPEVEADFPPNPQGSLHKKRHKKSPLKDMGSESTVVQFRRFWDRPWGTQTFFFQRRCFRAFFVDRNMAVPPECREQRIEFEDCFKFEFWMYQIYHPLGNFHTCVANISMYIEHDIRVWTIWKNVKVGSSEEPPKSKRRVDLENYTSNSVAIGRLLASLWRYCMVWRMAGRSVCHRHRQIVHSTSWRSDWWIQIQLRIWWIPKNSLVPMKHLHSINICLSYTFQVLQGFSHHSTKRKRWQEAENIACDAWKHDSQTQRHGHISHIVILSKPNPSIKGPMKGTSNCHAPKMSDMDPKHPLPELTNQRSPVLTSPTHRRCQNRPTS